MNREEYFPDWLNLASYLIFFLFPVTLAYVIVVHRALDVRVVIRQGLQYTFASGGILVLRIAMISGVAMSVYVVASRVGNRSLLSTLIIAAGVGLAIALGKLLRRLRAWTDRRFFRDAYNAEQILSDLGDQVRSLLDTAALFKTVSERIAESLHVNQVAVLVMAAVPIVLLMPSDTAPPPRWFFQRQRPLCGGCKRQGNRRASISMTRIPGYIGRQSYGPGARPTRGPRRRAAAAYRSSRQAARVH